MSKLGVRLKELRKTKKLTQPQLAEKLKVGKSTVAMWETGDREPDYDMLQKIAEFFDVSVDYLLGRTDDPTPPGKEKEDPFADLPEDMNMFFKDFEKLSDEDKRLIAKQVKALLKMAEEENRKNNQN